METELVSNEQAEFEKMSLREIEEELRLSFARAIKSEYNKILQSNDANYIINKYVNNEDSHLSGRGHRFAVWALYGEGAKKGIKLENIVPLSKDRE